MFCGLEILDFLDESISVVHGSLLVWPVMDLSPNKVLAEWLAEPSLYTCTVGTALLATSWSHHSQVQAAETISLKVLQA